MGIIFAIYLLVFIPATIIWLNFGKFNKAKLWTVAVFWFLIPSLVFFKEGFSEVGIPFFYLAIVTIGGGITDYLPDKPIGFITCDGIKFLVLSITGLIGGLYLLSIESPYVGYILLFFATIFLMSTISDTIEARK